MQLSYSRSPVSTPQEKVQRYLQNPFSISLLEMPVFAQSMTTQR